MQIDLFQTAIFFGVTAAIGFFTWLKCRTPRPHTGDGNRDYFLAGGSLTWPYIAGSITLTNLSTDQLVGMNGNQMLLIAWWELAAVAGLVILAYVFLPLYYKYQCTTTTELLEKKLGGKALRATISALFLLGGAFIYLPIGLYTGALFMKTMFGADLPIVVIAAALALVGAAYAVFGGLRAVAVSDTYSGVGILGLALLVAFLAAQAIGFDFSGVPAERLSMIGGPASPIPFSTLFTGMIFIQIFYWSFNQTITQRAMAAPSIAEARRGVLAAAAVRLMIIPAIIAVPGVVAYKLFGEIGDAAYGRVVAVVLPSWLSGAFAAMMAAAVLTSVNSGLNSAAALYVCDLHEPYLKPIARVRDLAVAITIGFTLLAVALVPVYSGAKSIINLVQQLNGLLSMPILSAFFIAIFFRNVDPRAALAAVIAGTIGYGLASFYWVRDVHYIHTMFVTLIACMAFALLLNRVAFGRRATLSFEDFCPPSAIGGHLTG
ncbi:MAG: sodium:solute symporter family transporter [Parvularculaceae bacterium]